MRSGGEEPHASDDLMVRDEGVRLSIDTVRLRGQLTVPQHACGVVVFAHGSGSSRHHPRNRQVACRLNQAGMGTLLFDLLTPGEGAYRVNVFDIDLLSRRLAGATSWLRRQPGLARVPVGWFGSGTGATAALWAAAEPGCDTAAVVSRSGRPDLAGRRLGLVRAPTLLVVGELDPVVWGLNNWALERLGCQASVAVIHGATHLFEEPGALEKVTESALPWFLSHLRRANVPQPGPAASPADDGT